VALLARRVYQRRNAANPAYCWFAGYRGVKPMIGHLYTLLFVGGDAVAPPVEQVTPGYGGFRLDPPRKRKREAWQDELARLREKLQPEAPKVAQVAEPVAVVVPQLTKADQAYIDGALAAIIQAKNEQEAARKAIEAAQAEQERAAAELLLMQAIEAERIAQQEMMDFDIAFVAAVLASS